MTHDRCTTVWTGPNGTADAVQVGRGLYRVRARTAQGTWVTTGARFTTANDAAAHAREVDKFRPDGTGRF